MARITYQDFVDNYLPKNGEPGNEAVFFRSPELLKRELDSLGDIVDMLLNNNNIPNWSTLETYAFNDLAVLDGVIYISLTDNNLGNQPPNATYWKKLVFPTAGGTRWRPGTDYVAGDIVDYVDAPSGLYDDHGTDALFRCTSAHQSISGIPPYDLLGTSWEYASGAWFGANKFVIQDGDVEPTVGVTDGDILIVWEP